MSNPRIYEFTSIDPKTGKPTTVVNRMREKRKAIKLGNELIGRPFTMAEYREHLELEKLQTKNRERLLMGDYKWLPEFVTMIGLNPDKEIFVAPHGKFPVMRVDLVTVRKAWKRLAAQLHPDRDGGDAIKATRLNELWSLYETSMRAEQLKYVPPPTEPTVMPIRKRKKVQRHKTHIANSNPDCAEYTTACGKSVEDVTVVSADCSAAMLPRLVTCKKCRAAWRAPITVTKKEETPMTTQPPTIERDFNDEGWQILIPEAEAQAMFVDGAEGVVADVYLATNRNCRLVTFEREGRYWQLAINYFYGKPSIGGHRQKKDDGSILAVCPEVWLDEGPQIVIAVEFQDPIKAGEFASWWEDLVGGKN
jgi:hypothetical protein